MLGAGLTGEPPRQPERLGRPPPGRKDPSPTMSWTSSNSLYLQSTNPLSKVKAPDNPEVSTMAATIFVEVESGTCSGRVHPHNGYYAGDFSSQRNPAPESQRESSCPTPLVSRTA
jgi:hypothetical protein